tara:strand:- start:13128 stop:14204 length:1077 start_codon:yes stop_codon:yes gene_type:complete
MYYLRQFSRLLFFSILYWSFIFCLFIFIRFVAYGEEENYHYDKIASIETILKWLPYGIVFGILIGVLYAVIEFLFEKLLSKKLFLGIVLIFKSIIYFIGLVFSTSYIVRLIELQMNIDLPNGRLWWFYNDVFWVVTVYFVVASFMFLFIRIANDKFGRGVLINMLIGKYRNPREEERLFMFIDLKSSTTLAEKLGHYKYSKLLQDCFFDLNKILDRYDAEIYQYVGDEAVISWKYNKGIKNNQCINLYFDFRKIIDRRSKYYLKHYDAKPFFKAGAHGGKLIVTEVGTLKKELAYHGDVINTTSRIQDSCTKYDKAFLISDKVLNDLKLKSIYKSKEIGDILLRGKQDRLKVHTIIKG